MGERKKSPGKMKIKVAAKTTKRSKWLNGIGDEKTKREQRGASKLGAVIVRSLKRAIWKNTTIEAL